jgi:DNA-directed RNA polymerase subunit RPC12/RpoP
MMTVARKFRCSDCSHAWEVPHGTGRPAVCPKCTSRNIHRAEEDRGWARGGGPGRRGRGGCGRGRGAGRSADEVSKNDAGKPTGGVQ